MTFAQTLAAEFHVALWQTEAVIRLLDEGNTIPFIARYRKEQHGTLDDQVLREMSERLTQLRALDARRAEITAMLQKLEVYTDELGAALEKAGTLSEMEDLYRPYRPKRRTRAMIARERGLEPLADLLLKQDRRAADPETLAAAFVNAEKDVPDVAHALAGAMDVIAERMSDDAQVRTDVKRVYARSCMMRVSAATDEDSVYRAYYDHAEGMRNMPPHRVLAVNRGEREGKLKVVMDVPETDAVRAVETRYVRAGSATTSYVADAAADAYDRLIAPSVQNELRAAMTENAQTAAIRVFAINLRPLLMQPPVKGRVTLGLDPGIRTGCKVAVVDGTGRVLDTGVIYPLPAHGKVAQSREILLRMIRKHGVTVAAIGNGTASRETEEFFVSVMTEAPDCNLSYMIVNEAGASVYSASKLAAQEFPQFDVSLRSAVSIARRLQDPLAELVKIDPKSIGVGQYQHDLKEAALDAALEDVVEDCVNAVGVDVNTASAPLLSHVAGIGKTVAQNIVTYREENGPFISRAALKKVPKLGPRAFEQSAGFLRVSDGREPLDNTGVHPESYAVARALLATCGCTAKTAVTGALAEAVEARGYAALCKELDVGEPTLRDIVRELQKPGRDPRDELPPPLLRKDVLSMDDLRPGMELTGTVRNVTDFGAFVDIGVHRDGLVHISQLPARVMRHPSEVVHVGDVATVWVLEVDAGKNRISLTMRKPEGEKRA